MVHGYVRGHELLATSVRVNPADQDEITRLSDLSGNLLGDDPPSYLTAYPLPSGSWYALAQTWPDAQASRRGCVITRTALVPMGAWQSGVPVEAIAKALLPVDRALLTPKMSSLAVEWKTPLDHRPIATSLDLQLSDFVSRLFLEPVPSLIWPIDGSSLPDVERLALRLLAFMWPARRRQLSLCTYALQPRQVAGSPFQVMFVPSEALGRFRATPRHVVGQSAPSKSFGHRGEHVLRAVRQVLNGQAGPASWKSYSELAHLLPDQPDALLRLATLDDLRLKGAQSPNALLAALDVWAGLAPDPAVAEDRKRTVATEVLTRADGLTTEEALNLTTALLQRLVRSPFRALSDLRGEARAHITQRAANDVNGAIEWVAADGKVRRNLMALVARGLAEAPRGQIAALAGLQHNSDLAVVMLGESPGIATRYLDELPRAHAAERVRLVEKWVNDSSPGVQLRAARQLVQSPSLMHSERLARLVAEHAEPTDVGTLLNSANTFSDHEPPWNVLTELVSRYPDEARSHFLSATRFSRRETGLFARTLNEKTIADGLRHLSAIGAREAVWLALYYLAARKPAKPMLVKWMTPSADQPLLKALWSGVLARVEEATEGFERFLAEVSTADVLATIRPTELLQPEAGLVRATVLRPVLTTLMASYLSGESDGKQLWSWVDVARKLGAGVLFDQIADRSALAPGGATHPERVWLLVEARLALLPNLQARPYAERIQQAIALSRDNHTVSSVAIWTRLVSRALEMGREYRELIGLSSFEAAFRSRRLPVSPIVVTSFPVLYEGLPGRRRETMFLGLLPFPIDIDKRKDARRELVDAFLQSNWPPSDLALAGHRAKVLPKILARLRQLERTDYIQRMASDLEARPELGHELATYVRNAGSGDDDS